MLINAFDKKTILPKEKEKYVIDNILNQK